MIKKFLIILMLVTFSNCSENTRAKKWGGTMDINPEKGCKVSEITWKDDQVWYLCEEMEPNYVPQLKKFKEASTYGIIEGEVDIQESR